MINDASVITEDAADINDVDEDSLLHAWCPGCYATAKDVKKSVCGKVAEVRKEVSYREGPDVCVVCVELCNIPCEHCGF